METSLTLVVYACYCRKIKDDPYLGNRLVVIAAQDAKTAILIFIEEMNFEPISVVPLDGVFANGMPRLLAI
jgi:hypothetical protein